ncbi:MAG: hypothetical protein C4539_01395 [Ignavibacteriales bacterium]|nr:MAG: hypothetical protein C4539_01395 [Ignavibacteriales bacterium]
MLYHAILLVIHILSAVIWLSFLPADVLLRQYIANSKGKPEQKKFISFYLKQGNLTGAIGMTGVLVTGILLVLNLPFYGFFDFSANHWLATKQIIMVILVFLTAFLIVPKAKALRTKLISDLNSNENLDDNFFKNLSGLYSVITLSNVLVLINLLLAITHRFI